MCYDILDQWFTLNKEKCKSIDSDKSSILTYNISANYTKNKLSLLNLIAPTGFKCRIPQLGSTKVKDKVKTGVWGSWPIAPSLISLVLQLQCFDYPAKVPQSTLYDA